MYGNRNIQKWTTTSVVICAVFVLCILANLTWLLLAYGNDQNFDIDDMKTTMSRLQGQIRLLEASVLTKELRWKGMEEMSQFYVNHMRRFITSNNKCREKLKNTEKETNKLITAHKEELKAVHDNVAISRQMLSICQNEKENEVIRIEKERKEMDKKKEYYTSLAAIGLSATGNCSTIEIWSRDRTLEDIYNVFGAEPLIALYKAGGDLGSYLPQIKTLEEKRKIVGSKGTTQPRTDVEINMHHQSSSHLTAKAVANMKAAAKANMQAGPNAKTKA